MNTSQAAESLKTFFKAKHLDVIITEYGWTVRIEVLAKEPSLGDIRVNVGSYRCGAEGLTQLVIWDDSFNLVTIKQAYVKVLKIWAYIHNIKLIEHGK